MHSDAAVIIPARISSQRLVNKMLQSIGDYTLIEHTVLQVKKTGLKNIYVAADSPLIASKVVDSKVSCIMTNANCSSGTDRVHQALESLPNKEQIKYVINVQGDMPFIDPAIILKVIEELKKGKFPIITPVAYVDEETANSVSNVKVVTDLNGKALYFSRRLIPFGVYEFLYHVGVYGFLKETLSKFVALPPSPLEQAEQLEQLRALQNNIEIGVCLVDKAPISVDTQEDLDKAREYYSKMINK